MVVKKFRSVLFHGAELVENNVRAKKAHKFRAKNKRKKRANNYKCGAESYVLIP